MVLSNTASKIQYSTNTKIGAAIMIAMLGQERFQTLFTSCGNPAVIGLDDHAIGYRCITGRHQAVSLQLDQAHLAGTEGG